MTPAPERVTRNRLQWWWLSSVAPEVGADVSWSRHSLSVVVSLVHRKVLISLWWGQR